MKEFWFISTQFHLLLLRRKFKMLTVSLKYFCKLTQLNKFLTWVDLLELIIGAMKKGRQNGAS